MNFNFSETAAVSQSNTRKQLEGNKIHDVIFDGCEARDFQGSQDATKTFHVLEVKFHNEDGVFTHTIWEPREEDFKDRQSAYGTNPSNVKAMMMLFNHLIDAVNPELGKKIKAGEANLNAASWDGLRKLVVESTDPGKGKATKIKLLKNNKGEAMFPYFANYSREGKLYMSTNFIGNGVFFTNKELDKIKKAENAKPQETTSQNNMFDLNAPVPAANDFDLDI